MADPNLKLRIETSADVSGAKETKDALKDVREEAGRTEDKADAAEAAMQDFGKTGTAAATSVEAAMERLNKKFDAVENEVADFERRSAPQSPSGSGVGDIAKGNLVAKTVFEGVKLAGEAVKLFVDRMSEGIGRARDLAVELEGLDEASRRAMLEGLGPLGDLIAENSPHLERLANDLKSITSKTDDLWTAAGVRLAPALAEVAEVLRKVDTVTFGAELGEVAGGVVVLAVETGKLLSSLDAAAGGTGTWTGALSRMTPILSQATSNVADFFRTLNAGAEYENAFDPERLAAQAQQLADARRQIESKVESEIGQIRKQAALDALPPEERLLQLKELQVAAQERLANAQNQTAMTAAGDEVVRLEKTISALEAQLSKQYQITAEKQKQARLSAEQQALDEASKNFLGGLNEIEQERSELKAAQLKTLQSEIALVRERGQTEQAELATAGATETQRFEARMANAEEIRQIELLIAKIRGDSSYEELMQAEDRKQEQFKLTELKQKEAEASKQQLASETAITQTQQARGRQSAPLQNSPLGPSGLNTPVDLLNPAQPRDLGPELTPFPKPTPAPVPVPTAPAPAPQPSPTQPGQPAQPQQAADPAAALQAALDAITAKLEALNTAATQLGQSVPAAIEEITTTLTTIPVSVDAATFAAMGKLSEITSAIQTLRTQVANLRV